MSAVGKLFFVAGTNVLKRNRSVKGGSLVPRLHKYVQQNATPRFHEHLDLNLTVFAIEKVMNSPVVRTAKKTNRVS